MMVYGHPTPAPNGAFFLQNFLTSMKPPPDDLAAPHHPFQGGFLISTNGNGGNHAGFVQQQQQQPMQQAPPQFLPPPQQLQQQPQSMSLTTLQQQQMLLSPQISSHATTNGASSSTGSTSNGGGGGFLYNLLTARDASAVQQRSAFHGTASPVPSSSVNAASTAISATAVSAAGNGTEFFPRRSNSMGHPQRRGSLATASVQHLHPSMAGYSQTAAGGAAASSAQGGRPSSATAAAAGASCSNGGGSEEPLDLRSSMRLMMPGGTVGNGGGLGSGSSGMGSPPEHQPMLRTILSQAAHRYQSQLQPVQLAKKNVMVAQSHVSDWLRKGSELVQTNATLFSSLDRGAQATLLCRAWPRILQLYMLENSFHFAVTPSGEAVDEAAASGGSAARLPTKKFADDLQRLITAVSTIPFDNMTYNLLRLAAIFKAETPQELHLQEVQEEILKHVLRHLEMKGMSSNFQDAVAILHAVSETDKDMLENLFCRHLLNLSVDEFIKAKLSC